MPPDAIDSTPPGTDQVTLLNFLVLLLPLALLLAAGRVFQPMRMRLYGARVVVVPLPLLARVRMQAVPAALITLLAIVLTIYSIAPWWAPPAVIAAMAILAAIPISYVLTTEGIRLGWADFRRWTEFAGVVRAKGGARLLGATGARPFRIWLSGSLGDDEFLHLLRQMIKAAYKGAATDPQVTEASALGVGLPAPESR